MQGSKTCEGRLLLPGNTGIACSGLTILYVGWPELLKLGWVRAEQHNVIHNRQTSIDPVVIAKMMIIGFLYNINSERQLMREIQVILRCVGI